MTRPSAHSLLCRLAVFGLIALAWVLVVLHAAPYGIVGSDFVQDFAAALSSQEGRSLYGAHIGETASALGVGWEKSEFENFHPPFLALLALPFTSMSITNAFLAWIALQALLMVASVVMVLRRTTLAFGAISLTLACMPIWAPAYSTLCLGQSNGLLLFLLTACWLMRRSESETLRPWAAAPLALASLIKLFPAFFLLLFLLNRDWRALLVYTVVFGSGLAICAALFGADDIILYAREIAPRDVAEWAIFPINHSIRGVVQRTFAKTPYTTPLFEAPFLISWIAGLFSATVVAIDAAWLLHLRRYELQQKTRDLIFWSQTIPMFLLSPITWQHSMTLMAPLFLLMLSRIDLPIARITALIGIAALLPVDVELARNALNLHPHGIPWLAAIGAVNLPFWTLITAACGTVAIVKRDFRALGSTANALDQR